MLVPQLPERVAGGHRVGGARSSDSPHWQRWVEWNFQRHRAGVEVVAEAIRKANPRTVAMFNWLWARSPEPAPAFVDAITGDNVGGVDTFLSVGQRLGANRTSPGSW